MGCGTSRMHEDEYYIEATRSVQTSPVTWDEHSNSHEHYLMDHVRNHKNLKIDNIEMHSPDENTVLHDHKNQFSPQTFEKEDHSIHRSSTFIHLHDQRLDSPTEHVFHKEYATQGATSRLDRKKLHSSADNDEGYKSDSNSRPPRIRHQEIDSDPEHHYHRRRRSRRRPSSVGASIEERHAKAVVETKEKKINVYRPKRHPGTEKYAKQTKMSNVSALSSSTTTTSISSSSSKDTGIRVAGGKHRKGQPPPPWRVHYVQSKPPWMNDYLDS